MSSITFLSLQKYSTPPCKAKEDLSYQFDEPSQQDLGDYLRRLRRLNELYQESPLSYLHLVCSPAKAN